MSSVLRNPFVQKPQPQQTEQQSGNNQPNPNNLAGDRTAPDNGNSGTVPDNDNSNLDSNNSDGDGDDPLAEFKGLWEDDPIDPKKPPEDDNAPFMPAMDSKKMSDALGRVDFTAGASAEELAALTAGGEGATKAVSGMVNRAVRKALMIGNTFNARMSEAGIAAARVRIMKNVPNSVRDQLISGNLSKSNPIVNNPMYAPIVDSVRTRIQAKFQKASPDAVEKMVNNYFDSMSQDISKARNPDKVVTDEDKLRTGSADADWNKWLDDELKAQGLQA